MKYIFLLITTVFLLNAAVIRTPLLSLSADNSSATIKIENVEVGVSGFIHKQVSVEHTSILKSVVVTHFDKTTKIATLKINDYIGLQNNSLPSGKWSLNVGDIATLAFGYTRSLLIAPNEEIYHKITKSVRTQWLHADIFATLLSIAGHPTPLKSDFEAMSNTNSIGIVFIYLDKKIYMLDIKSFKILSISDINLVQDSVILPFYSRIEEIDANWFGAGSDYLTEYESYYFSLIKEFNHDNKNLLKNITEYESKGTR